MVEAVVSTSSPSITLSWRAFPARTDSPSTGGIRGRPRGWHFTSVAGSASSYTDNAVTTGVGYEHKVVRNASSGTGYGYIATGIQLPAIEERRHHRARGEQHRSSLATETGQLELDSGGRLRRETT